MNRRKTQTSPPDTANDWRDQNKGHVVLYEALTARVGHRDALLWQSAALAMTAQAFLLVIALGHDSGAVARFAASLLGCVVTYMSAQLMLKHRMYLTNDQVMMISLERTMGLPTSAIDYESQLAHIEQDTSKPLLRERAKEKKWLTRFTSVNIWVYGLSAFGIVNLALMVFAVLDALGVPCAWTIQTAAGAARCVLGL